MAQPDCPLCGGTGWKTVERPAEEERLTRVSREKPVGEPSGLVRPAGARQAGGNATKGVWAVPCDCTGKDRDARAMTRARIPAKYRDRDFENFDTGLYVGNPKFKADEGLAYDLSLSEAKLVVEAFARDFPIGRDVGLLLMGRCGTGKTHLAIAALRQLVLRGHSGLFYDYGELLRTIQDSYNPNSQTTELGILAPVLESEVLLIDDLGFIKPSDWVREMVAHILNSRYNAHRTTILTSMYSDEESTAISCQGGHVPENNASVAISRLNRGKFRLASGQDSNLFTQDTLEKRIGTHIRSRLYEMCRTIELFAPDYRREVRRAGRVRSQSVTRDSGAG